MLYKPYDIEDLKEKLKMMSCCSDEQINKMRENNINAVKTSLNETEMARKFEDICNQLVERNKQKSKLKK